MKGIYREAPSGNSIPKAVFVPPIYNIMDVASDKNYEWNAESKLTRGFISLLLTCNFSIKRLYDQVILNKVESEVAK